MKRYVVFGGDVYYPSGGWNDYKVDFADRIQAISWAEGFTAGEVLRWAHVVDMADQTIVWESRS